MFHVVFDLDSWSQNSCAYDAALSIIHSVWDTDEPLWSRTFTSFIADLLGELVLNFARNRANLMKLESARDYLHRKMSSISQRYFGWVEFSSSQLLAYMLTAPSVAIK